MRGNEIYAYRHSKPSKIVFMHCLTGAILECKNEMFTDESSNKQFYQLILHMPKFRQRMLLFSTAEEHQEWKNHLKSVTMTRDINDFYSV